MPNPITHHHRTNGITIVELLVALAIASIFLGLITAYLNSTMRHNDHRQRQQALNDITRTITEQAAQDLQNAGAQGYVDATGNARYVQRIQGATSDTSGLTNECTSTDRSGCVILTSNTLRLVHATSLQPNNPCRSVEYTYEPNTNTLYRAEVDCGDTPPAPINDTILGDNITSFSVTFYCAPTPTAPTSTTNPTTCYANNSVITAARIDVTAEAPSSHGTISDTFHLTVNTPNLQRLDPYSTGGTP